MKKPDEKQLLLSKLTLDFISEMVFWIDSSGGFFMVNEAACKNLEYSQQQLLELSVSDIDTKNSIEYFQERWIETEREGKVVFDIFFKTRSDQFFPSEITANFVEFEGDKYLCAVARDISERREVEDILIASEERYRTLFEYANDAIFLMDQKKFLECNDKTLEIYGCNEKSDIIGHSPWEFSPQSQPDGSLSIKKANNLIKDALNGEPQKFYWKHTRLDGAEFDAEVSLNRMVIHDKMLIQAIVRDKTDEIATLNELKESEEKFIRAFHNNPSSLHITSIPDGKFVEVNSLFEKLSGYKKEELIGKTSVELGFYEKPEDRDNLFSELQEKGRLVDYEITFKVRSGEHLLCRVFSEIVEIKGIPLLVSTVQDITEKKRDEEALNQSEANLSALLNATKDISFLIDRNGILLALNKSLSKPEGKSVEEMIGMNVFDMLPANIAQERKKWLTKVNQSGRPVRFEDINKGNTFYNTVYPIFNDEGKIDRYAVYARNITDQKKAEDVLLNERNLLRSIIDSIPDHIYIKDTQHRFEISNAFTLERFGVKKHTDVIGKTDLDFLDKSIAEEFHKEERELFRTGKPIINKLIKSRDKDIWGLHSKFPLKDIHGKLIGLIGYNKNITQLKLAEIELKREKEFADQILDTVVDTIFVFDPQNGKPVRWNKALKDVSGFTDKEISNKVAPTDWYSKDDVEKTADAASRMLKGENPILEMSFITKKGTLIPTEYTSSMIIDQEGQPQYIIAVGRDITERKKTEIKLKESEEKYRTMAETSPDAVTTADMNGKITYVSKRTLEIHGFNSEEELLGTNVFSLFDQLDLERAKQNLENAMSLGSVRDVEYTLLKKDGSKFDAEISGSLIKDVTNAPIGLIAITKDITDRKLAQKALMESEERYRLLIENSPTVAWKTDKSGKTEFISSNVELVYGYTPAEIYENGPVLFIERIHPEEQEMVSNAFNKLFSKGTEYDVEYRIKNKEGNWIWLQDKASIVQEENEKQFAYGVFSDITGRKESENALRKSEEKFSKAFHTSPNLMAISTLEEGRIIEVNNTFEKLSRRKREELIGKRVLDFGLYANPEDRIRILEEIKKKQRLKNFEVQFKLEDDIGYFNVSGELIEIEGETCILAILEDITERKRNEEELRKLSGVVEQSPMYIVITNPDGMIEYVNPAFSSITGYTREEVIGKNPRVLKSGETPLSVYENLWNTILSGNTWKGEFKNKKKNGTMYWESATISPSFNKAGVITHFVSIKEDITERKKAENTIRENEARNKAIIEALPDLLFRIDKNGTYLDISGPEEDLALPAEELLGKRFTDILPADVGNTLLQKIRESLNDNQFSAVEYSIPTIKGETQYFEGRISPIDSKEVLFIARNITEKRKSEEAIRKSEEKFSAAFQTSPNIMTISILENGEILEVNTAFVEKTGYDRVEAIGKSSYELNFWVNLKERENLVDEFRKKGKVIGNEIRMRIKNGDIKIYNYSGEILNIEGNQCGLSVFEDITERKKAEVEIKTYQENLRSMANELNLVEERERRRIAVNLHDHLSQSLAMAKIKLSGLKKEDLPPKLAEVLKESNRYITDAIENSRSITYELSPPVLYELGLTPAIQWKLENLEAEHNININFNIDGAIPDIMEDHQILIFRSVSELLNNVIKHAAAKHISVSINEENGLIKISVKDDGKGFDPKSLPEKVIERGGFGLFSIRERLGYFNGKLELASERGQGTTVSLTIPVHS